VFARSVVDVDGMVTVDANVAIDGMTIDYSTVMSRSTTRR
jgi:hypothetical protein